MATAVSRESMINGAEVRRALDEARLDALIAVSPENTFYFSAALRGPSGARGPRPGRATARRSWPSA